MELQEYNIVIPKDMWKYLKVDEDQTELERNALLLYPYIKNLTISHGRAAEILGITKWELITLYDDLGLAYLDQDISEIQSELKTFNELKGELK